jgi:hypothetical protein
MLKEIKELDTSSSEIFQKQIEFMYDKAVQQQIAAGIDEPKKEQLRDEFNKKLLIEVKSHLDKPVHPISKLIAKFNKAFSHNFSDLVETSSAESKQILMDRIRKKGEDFCKKIFENVKSFQIAMFDSLVCLYDPNYKGILESIEHEIDDTLCDRIIQG